MATFRELWIRWKMLKLPWRKQFLIGQDLSGNTFWEFKDKLNANRLRRIAKPRRASMPLSDLSLSPQWHQWLRQTRVDPPTIQEQHDDIVRQVQLKHNTKLADERWASKARYIEQPKPRTPIPYKARVEEQEEGMSLQAETENVQVENMSDAQPQPRARKPDPWAESDAASKSRTKWEPEAWVPGVSNR